MAILASVDNLEERLGAYDPADEVCFGEGYLRAYPDGTVEYQGREIGKSLQVFRAMDALRLWIVLEETLPHTPGHAVVYVDEEDGVIAELIFPPGINEMDMHGNPATESIARIILCEAMAYWSTDADDDPIMTDEDLFFALELWASITQN